MNYKKIYNSLMIRGSKRFDGTSISKAKKAIPFYVERHRIIPGCMGGKYVEGNVAWLTPEEHFVAHQLLVKMHPENTKLIYAAHAMTVSTTATAGRVRNKLYGWLKRLHARAVSIQFKDKQQSEEHRKKLSNSRLQGLKTGKITVWNKNKHLSEEHRSNLSKAHQGQIPWHKGKKCPQISKKTKGSKRPIISEKMKNNQYAKGHKLTKKHIQAITASVKDSFWWTNGLIDARSRFQPDASFKKGRTKYLRGQ